jgi:hypothetical protein
MKNEIIARTTISGIVNGSAFKGDVIASFDPSRGGRSSCRFSELPPGFTPATFGNQT